MISPLFLEHMRIASYGAFGNVKVGPFKPGLNVVFGKNEAGKTTVASFVGGVLFGWEDARGSRNTYKPSNAERAGSLFFASSEGHEEVELSRVRNADGLVGDAALVADIDRETFRTMFSLNSDALRSLRNTTDVTAKLLTAGSGTSSSPAHALAEVQGRLAEYASRAAGIEHSLVNLAARQSKLREQMAQAAQEAERFKQQDKEFYELAPQRKELSARLASLNTCIEDMTACRVQLQKEEEEREALVEENDRLEGELAELARSVRAVQEPSEADSSRFSAAEDRVTRERIDSYSERQLKANHRVEAAKESFDVSRAAYEALLEARGQSGLLKRARHQRRVQVTLSIVLPLMFVCAGVLVFVHGRRITSLSFTALGLGLVLFSLILAAAALVMLFRPNKAEEEREERLQNAHWVMLQDEKKLEACEADREELRKHIVSQLELAGLGAAQGSLRRARALLDEMKEDRANRALLLQRMQALSARRTAIGKSLEDLAHQKARIYGRVELPLESSLAEVDEEIARKTRQRTSLMETFEHVNKRYGELKQELSQARKMREFDALKLDYQQVRTRQEESALDCARLLLAKRMLERAIAAWESKSQPEVYRQASRLLSLMTEGKWVKVDMTQEGKLQVTDAVKTVRDPLHLSLGTCQQLYLSLRIALLLAADNVGRAIPILADDILVNFDARRRVGAARALAELAGRRQVILFTCHEEVMEALREAEPALNVVEL